MAGKKGNKAHANKTSYPNQKNRTVQPSVIHRKLLEIKKNAIEDQGITSWQGAVLSIGWRVTKMDYWCEKIPVFGTFKKEVKQILISRVDNKALNNKFQPTASIWRMKQLGEKEEQIIDHRSKGESLNPIKLNPEAAKEISKKIDDNI